MVIRTKQPALKRKVARKKASPLYDKKIKLGHHYDLVTALGSFKIELGLLQGYRVAIYHNPKTKNTSVRYGCREHASPAAMLKFYDNRRSARSDEFRPHVHALIDFASAVCAINGWRW